jgi:hypothetical protein
VSGWIRGDLDSDADEVVATYTALILNGLRPV